MIALKNEIEYKLGLKLAEIEEMDFDLGRPYAPPKDKDTYWTLMEVYDMTRFRLLRKLDNNEIGESECMEILNFTGRLCNELSTCNEISLWRY